jgi:hypothetical protein
MGFKIQQTYIYPYRSFVGISILEINVEIPLNRTLLLPHQYSSNNYTESSSRSTRRYKINRTKITEHEVNPSGSISEIFKARVEHRRSRELHTVDLQWHGIQLVGDNFLKSLLDCRNVERNVQLFNMRFIHWLLPTYLLVNKTNELIAI